MIIIPGVYNAQTHVPGGSVQGQTITVGAILKVTERDRDPLPSDYGTPNELWINNNSAIGFLCKESIPGKTVWDRIDLMGDYIAFGDNDPTVNTDIRQGFRAGSLRYARNTQILWICNDNTQGAAVWSQVGSGGSGTVSQVDTGTGLSGGPITNTGTISLNNQLAPAATLTGNAGNFLRVNALETAVEYVAVPGGGDMLKATYDVDNDGIVDKAERVEIIVRNSTGSTLTKGQIVYLFGATGNRPNALLSDASTEATSSKTIGMVVANIANNADGFVAVSGTLHDLATNMFSDGDSLWLSTTPGGMVANTPPAEPNHAVFIGYVARAHPTQGRVVLKIQNGYELNELHGVLISSEANNDLLVYETSSTLWKNKSLGTVLGGNTSQYVRGDGSLATFPTIPTVTPSALTKVDDTNVTLTLGGTPSTALLQPSSLTLGWTGQLAVSRGGTGLSALGSSLQVLRVNSAGTSLEYATISTGGITALTGDVSASGTGSVVATLKNNLRTGTFGVTVDGVTGVVQVGTVGYVVMPYDGTITGWSITANTSGSIQFDIWKATNAIPTVGDTQIPVAANRPKLTSQQYVNSTTLTGWTTLFLANDVYGFYVDSASTIKNATLTIRTTKS